MCLFNKDKRQIRLTNQRIKELTAINELSTTEYTVTKVVKSEEIPSLFQKLAGERKVLFSCKAFIKAGIDMESYDPSKSRIDPDAKTISLTLPHARVQSFNMPTEHQEIVYEKIGTFRRTHSLGELNEFLKQGEEIVRNEIAKMGILEDAERNARDLFKAALMQLGYQSITIKFADDEQRGN